MVVSGQNAVWEMPSDLRSGATERLRRKQLRLRERLRKRATSQRRRMWRWACRRGLSPIEALAELGGETGQMSKTAATLEVSGNDAMTPPAPPTAGNPPPPPRGAGMKFTYPSGSRPLE